MNEPWTLTIPKGDLPWITHTCSIEGCERPIHARGLCKTCYVRLHARGEIVNLPKRTVLERLATKLVRMPNGCLEWSGATNQRGYGWILTGSRTDGTRRAVLTHRLAWELVNGPIPDGLFACHHCDNPPCCDVEHLFLGTNADNVADKVAKGRCSSPSGTANRRVVAP